ncbi:putative nicotinate phosphoribosyltransferase [Podosphaera aphanis]|nr:putative nicotinate phosphoribosyltransferase [Podosphaera aphanis]
MELEETENSVGVNSFLDTDLYKLTMQCAALKFFPDVQVTYIFKNRSPSQKLSRAAFNWLTSQILKLGNIALTNDELAYLKSSCTYLEQPYLDFLQNFRLQPEKQVVCSFIPDDGSDRDDATGTLDLTLKGSWVETILYEVPLLALISEAFFRFVDTNWTYDGQEDKAYAKGMRLLQAGCHFSEFGTRRRRDYRTQVLVIRGLMRAKREGERLGLPGTLTGTSNISLAKHFGISIEGTMGHEWIMGIAAITGNYKAASINALDYWIKCYGDGVLSIALTDTFGTPAFLRGFQQPVPSLGEKKTFAESFNGVRQDSGDPENFVRIMKDFYEKESITEKKKIIFSDSLDIDRCLKYQKVADLAGFACSFGIGTFLTNDFIDKDTHEKSKPMNIVIKLSSTAGNPTVKLSDDAGKTMGDSVTVAKVKEEVAYSDDDFRT